MLAWLKRKLRNWLLEDDELNFNLDCIISYERKPKSITYLISRSSGLRLYGVPINQPEISGSRLIDEREACNKKQFWKLWKHFSSDNVCWEDGKPFEPE